VKNTQEEDKKKVKTEKDKKSLDDWSLAADCVGCF